MAEPNASVTVNGTSVASGATSGSINLDVGPNTITTSVTAENGAKKTYTTTLNRGASSDATLQNLTPNRGALAPVFEDQIEAYQVQLASDATSISITPVASVSGATITINGEVVVSGGSSGAITIFPGVNNVSASVIAPDGETTKSYTLEITLAEEEIVTLRILEVLHLTDEPGRLKVTWESEPATIYSLESSTDLTLWKEVKADLPSGGQSTSAEADLENTTGNPIFFRIKQN